MKWISDYTMLNASFLPLLLIELNIDVHRIISFDLILAVLHVRYRTEFILIIMTTYDSGCK